MNNAVINLSVQISLQDLVLSVLNEFPKVELLNLKIVLFLIFNETLCCFPSDCIILQSHQQCTRVSFSLHPCQHLVFSGFFDGSHSNGWVSQVAQW